MNVQEELNKVNSLLKHYNVKSRTKPYYAEIQPGYSLDLVFYKRLLNSFKRTKIEEVDSYTIQDNNQLVITFNNACYTLNLKQ